jgi:hypothetical protein
MAEDAEHLELSIALGPATFQASGPAEVVMHALEEFKRLAATAPAANPKPQPQRERETPQDPGDGAAATPPQQSAASKVPLPKFLQSPLIKDNPAIATAIVVWAADHDGKTSLTTGEIEKYWKGTPLKVPGNISRDISKAVKSGWLLRNQKSYSASGHGREAIGLS